MMLKDNNFISAVVYLHNDGARAVEFCRTVAAELDANFKQYELVVVDDACTAQFRPALASSASSGQLRSASSGQLRSASADPGRASTC